MQMRLLFFSLVFIISCRTTYHLDHSATSQYVMNDSTVISADSSLNAFIQPYREKVQEEMNVVLGESLQPLEKGLPESRLGNFVADACFNVAKKNSTMCDFAVFNSGGLRRGLPKGNITKGDIFELMPFENELVIITLNGKETESLLTFIASKGGAPVSGVRMQIENKLFSNAIISGVSFDTTRSYAILTSDYLANGGDGFFTPGDHKIKNLNIKVRDAIIQYITSLSASEKKIDVNTDGRITNVR